MLALVGKWPKSFFGVTVVLSFAFLLSSIIMSDLQENGCSQLPDWMSLDDLIMEKIFEQLPLRDRFNASLVCNGSSRNNKKVVELIEQFDFVYCIRCAVDGPCALNCRKFGKTLRSMIVFLEQQKESMLQKALASIRCNHSIMIKPQGACNKSAIACETFLFDHLNSLPNCINFSCC